MSTAPVLKVLVVDDEATVREVIVGRLSRRGHQVFEAESGKRALRLFEEGHSYDVVVCDIRMPGVDGFDVLKIQNPL